MIPTSTTITALRLLAADSVHCDDVAGEAITEAADRLEALVEELTAARNVIFQQALCARLPRCAACQYDSPVSLLAN